MVAPQSQPQWQRLAAPEPLRLAAANAASRRAPEDGLSAPPLVEGLPGLWRLDLAPAVADAAWVSLDDDERAHAARLRFDSDRRAYLNAHLTMRGVLATLLGTEAGALRFVRGPHGKPSLPGSGLGFNLSHCGPVGLLVAGPDGLDWGVDVERVRSLPDADAVARRVFTPAEQEALRHQPPAAQATAFMTLWTRKEACLKALGTGLTLDPARFEVGLAPEPTGAHGALALEVHVPLADGRIACVHCIDVGLGIEPDAGAPRPLVAAAAWTTSTAPNAASAGIGC